MATAVVRHPALGSAVARICPPRAGHRRWRSPAKLDLRYLGQSEVRAAAGGSALAFAPNLARDKVFFDGELVHPLRFREAMSALHEVVVGDLRAKKKDRSAWKQWKKEQAQQDAQTRRVLFDAAKQAELAKIADEPIPPNLEGDFRKQHRIYWDARVRAGSNT